MMLSAAFVAESQQRDSRPHWEQAPAPTETASTETAQPSAGDSGASVSVRDMYIYVDMDHPGEVTLFTILGQPVSKVQLPQGSSRLRVNARGIYILKIGSSTRRITI